MLGVYEVLEKRVGEATYTDDPFSVGGFNLLWALKLGEEGHVVCQRELMLARSRGLESAVRLFSLSLFGFVIRHPICRLEFAEKLWIFLSDPIPTCLDREIRIVFDGFENLLSGKLLQFGSIKFEFGVQFGLLDVNC
jgi:hypothetical protein